MRSLAAEWVSVAGVATADLMAGDTGESVTQCTHEGTCALPPIVGIPRVLERRPIYQPRRVQICLDGCTTSHMLISGRTSILALRHPNHPPKCGAALGGIPFPPWDAAFLCLSSPGAGSGPRSTVPAS